MENGACASYATPDPTSQRIRSIRQKTGAETQPFTWKQGQREKLRYLYLVLDLICLYSYSLEYVLIRALTENITYIEKLIEIHRLTYQVSNHIVISLELFIEC